LGSVNIENLFLTELKRIFHPKGDVLHCIKKSDKGFVDFGEAYFSTIKYGEVKGWNKHKKMTLNLVVPMGAVVFVVYDDRARSRTRRNFFCVEISEKEYQRLSVPPGVWLAFKGKGRKTNLILNVADLEHDSAEVERLALEHIKYRWDNI